MAAEHQSLKKHLSLFLRIGIAVLACWFLYNEIEPGQVAEAFGRLRISTILFSIFCFCIGLCLIGFRWWIFMRAQEIHVPIFLAIKLTFLGQFFSNFMPSAVGGDLVRAWYISHHTPYRLKAAIGVAADRFMGLSGTIILAFSSYMLFMRGHEDLLQIDKKENAFIAFFQNHPIPAHWFLIAFIVILGVIFFAARMFNVRSLLKKLKDITFHLLHQTYEVFLVYVHHPMILLFGLAISVFMQVLVLISFWLIGQDLGIPAPLHSYFVIFPLMWIVSSLPLSIAGIGILEGGLVVMFVQLTGASKESVMALALCQRLAWVIGSLPGLVVHLTGAHRKKDA